MISRLGELGLLFLKARILSVFVEGVAAYEYSNTTRHCHPPQIHHSYLRICREFQFNSIYEYSI